MEISYQNIWIKNNQQMRKEELHPEFIEQGISLYEVLRVIRGVPLFLEQHLERLKNSARLTNLELPLNDKEIGQRLRELINSNQVENGNIKFVINYPEAGKTPDFYAYFVEHSYPSNEDYQKGVKTVLVHVERPNPNAKVDRADYRNMVDEAKRRTDSYEALLVDREGNVSEGGRSNLFMVKGDVVYTAPGDKVLKGITRQMVLAACQNQGYQVVEKEISLEEMLNMDAIFISSTSPKVLPVSQVDDKIINSGSNKIIQDIMAGYDAIIDDYVKSHKS
ncbi:MAG: aminotransferase class IV [Syntrophomonadaceae bacterium]|nr:aminotransferase class IV [Syntrophomonadaceae bacterium]